MSDTGSFKVTLPGGATVTADRVVESHGRNKYRDGSARLVSRGKAHLCDAEIHLRDVRDDLSGTGKGKLPKGKVKDAVVE